MLTGEMLNRLFSSVFGYPQGESGHRFGFLVDVPTSAEEDTQKWRERRALAMRWARALAEISHHACMVYAYRSVGRSNADLVTAMHLIALYDEIPSTADELHLYQGEFCDVGTIFSRAEFWIALTEYSAAAPIKIAAARYGFKAASMPGFTIDMLPALAVDVNEVDARVSRLAAALTNASQAQIVFDAAGKQYDLTLDLRYRMGFASSGRFVCRGQAGNLPSGEAYIVPYEGEKTGVISLTSGIMPLECGGDIVLCEVEENRVVCIDGNGVFAENLRRLIARDPAMANIAELGLGILGEWGIEAIGNILFDEKLSLHIALGRSEHLGGVTSPSDFRSPDSAVHIDYVFHKKLMPDIHIARGILCFEDREAVFVLNDHYHYDDL